jgi:Domain of unknown function (DUF4112)
MAATARVHSSPPEHIRRFEALRRVSQLLDSAFAVPGTSFRVGLDPILGLVPGLGDLVTPLFTVVLLWQSRKIGVPRIVQLRMVFNAAIDALIGVVPLLGDLFDFAWKSNNRNLALLETHVYQVRHSTAGDWVFVIVVVTTMAAILAIPLMLAAWLIASLSRLF